MMFPRIAHPEDAQPGLLTSITLEILVDKAFKRDDILFSSSDPVATWNMPVSGGRNRTLTLEALVAAAFADGLSRYGLEKVLEPSLSPEAARRWQITEFTKNKDYDRRLLDDNTPLIEPQPTSSKVTITKFHTSILISGYAFQMQSATDYVAGVILGLHILLAICHITYTIYAGTSSSSWDSIVQLFVLAHRSLPPRGETSKNTSSGIYKRDTYRAMTFVRDREQNSGNEIETRTSDEMKDDENSPVEDRVELLMGITGQYLLSPDDEGWLHLDAEPSTKPIDTADKQVEVEDLHAVPPASSSETSASLPGVLPAQPNNYQLSEVRAKTGDQTRDHSMPPVVLQGTPKLPLLGVNCTNCKWRYRKIFNDQEYS